MSALVRRGRNEWVNRWSRGDVSIGLVVYGSWKRFFDAGVVWSWGWNYIFGFLASHMPFYPKSSQVLIDFSLLYLYKGSVQNLYGISELFFAWKCGHQSSEKSSEFKWNFCFLNPAIFQLSRNERVAREQAHVSHATRVTLLSWPKLNWNYLECASQFLDNSIGIVKVSQNDAGFTVTNSSFERTRNIYELRYQFISVYFDLSRH